MLINGDLAVRAFMDTERMEWAPSPSGSVWRKRVHWVGPAEAGQVTSVVRYEAHSQFPAHDHPAGEEIFVLDGVFSDEHGHWPAGTYLLHPEGFRHAPFSEHGCRLFVKLRQYPGRERRRVAVDTASLAWQPGATRGVTEKPLYEQPGFADSMRLVRWTPHTDLGTVIHARGSELFVLEGGFEDDAGSYTQGCWMRLPVGFRQHPRTTSGCTMYVKTAGPGYLQAAA